MTVVLELQNYECSSMFLNVVLKTITLQVEKLQENILNAFIYLCTEKLLRNFKVRYINTMVDIGKNSS